MNLYTVLVFLHLFGVIALFGGLVLLQNVGARLRHVATWEQTVPLVELLRPTRGMFAAGGIFLLGSGIWMTALRWSFRTPWLVSGMTVIVLAAVIGGLVVRRLDARITVLGRTGRGPLSDQDRARLASRGAWAAIFAINLAVFGVVWLMTVRPGWTQSIAVPLVLALIGVLVGAAVGRVPGAARERGARAFRDRQPAS